MPALHVQIEQNQVVSSLVVMRCDGSVSAFLQAKIQIQDAFALPMDVKSRFIVASAVCLLLWIPCWPSIA
jgi:glucose-6-phosphate isomerase